MSEIKVNKISPRTACGTVTVGDSGDSVCVSAGVAVTVQGDLKSPALKATDGGVIISQSGTDITVGASGDTIALASGATQTGFGRTGTVDWDTGSIKTAGFSAVSGNGYFCNTTSGIFTVALPAGSAGDIVAIADYAQTFNTNNLTVAPDGSEKIGGVAADATMSVNGVTATLVYVDGTQGWTVTDSGTSTDVPVPQFVTATGGTPCAGAVVCTNYKTHTFTGPGTFTVSCAGNAAGSTTIDYMIAAGGGAGGTGNPASGEGAGGAGAGGWRASAGTGSGCYTAGPSPLTAPVSPVTVSASPGAYPIVVGGGGASATAPSCVVGNDGNTASGFSITSAGGGGGGTRSYATPDTGRASGNPGGSGGGSAYSGPTDGTGAIGIGNTPCVSPPQGNSGGLRVTCAGGGGGGAVSVGLAPAAGPTGGVGGTGATSCITASPVGYSGGGGGGAPATGGPATQGGGTGGTGCATAPSGTTNTGGGGGGAKGPQASGAGGSGVVIIRYKFQ